MQKSGITHSVNAGKFHITHSTRVYLFGALAGIRKGLKFDSELLYIGAMFHDIGLTQAYRHSTDRFDGHCPPY
ncbi:MAG: HD domain-containing protein [Nostoc sp.]|uniref:HD domain-containing protein n=1 Tax=Nostoc sp. TaxID=1180 RepID=UPI002FFA61FB